ncbi:MAG: hypothetical protein GXY17_12090 [Clostridiaceae bacterium]|jgi:hypothetical protein|nr:hypothetical protein [Clostridiaceae bacterium]
MNEEVKNLMQNLTEARNTLRTNQLLLKQKTHIESEIQKAIDDENTAIKEKSDLFLSGLDHEIYTTKKEFNSKIQGISTEREKVRASLNELIAQSARVFQIDEMMNRSDAKHEKTMDNISTLSNFMNNGFVKSILRPLKDKLSVHESNYRERKIKQHSEEIAKLNKQKDDLLAKMQLSHSEALFQIDKHKKQLIEYDLQINDLIHKLENEVRSIRERRNELADWRRVSDQELLLRAAKNIAKEYRSEIDAIDAKIKENNDFLQKECRVSVEYQTDEILTKLISYLHNERATNIKEALELYLQEERIEDEKRTRIDFQNKQLQLQKQHFEQLNKRLEALNKADKDSSSK